MYILLCISLMLAFFFVLNLLASAAASIAWRIFSSFLDDISARRRVQIIFSLRIFPPVFAFVFVTAFLLPSYLLFERHSSGEIVTIKLAAPALISAIGLIITLYRVFNTRRATRRLIASWLKISEKITVKNVEIPVYCIRHPFPVIAVVGTFRPRMFVARQIFDSLSGDEFKAAVAHENGHLVTHDNFKRILLRVCRDLLIFPVAGNLDRAWIENSEAAADEYAAQTGGTSIALNLASALVKIARIVPHGLTPTMPVGAFLIEEQNIDITRRVSLLLDLMDGKRIFTQKGDFKFLFPLCLSVIFAATSLLATNQSLLQQIHFSYEKVVAILQ